MTSRRTVVVTGSGSGLGRATALRFARGGDFVLLIGRTQAKLDGTAAEIAAASPVPGVEAVGESATAVLDVAEAGAMDAALANLIGERGALHALVANAGINPQRADALETTDANWDETIRVNLTGTHRSCKAALPHMIANGGGAIVTLGSISGQIGMAERAAYGPTKAAIAQYTRNLAIDHAAAGVRANCICPGFVVTDLCRPWLEALPQAERAALIAKHPLGLGQPEDIAETVYFLCSDGARWITGVDLSVDGGYTAH